MDVEFEEREGVVTLITKEFKNVSKTSISMTCSSKPQTTYVPSINSPLQPKIFYW